MESFIQRLTWSYNRLGKVARDAIWPEAKRLIREYLVETEGLGHLEPPSAQSNVKDFFRKVNTTVTEKEIYPLCLLHLAFQSFHRINMETSNFVRNVLPDKINFFGLSYDTKFVLESRGGKHGMVMIANEGCRRAWLRVICEAEMEVLGCCLVKQKTNNTTRCAGKRVEFLSEPFHTAPTAHIAYNPELFPTRPQTIQDLKSIIIARRTTSLLATFKTRVKSCLDAKIEKKTLLMAIDEVYPPDERCVDPPGGAEPANQGDPATMNDGDGQQNYNCQHSPGGGHQNEVDKFIKNNEGLPLGMASPPGGTSPGTSSHSTPS